MDVGLAVARLGRTIVSEVCDSAGVTLTRSGSVQSRCVVSVLIVGAANDGFLPCFCGGVYGVYHARVEGLLRRRTGNGGSSTAGCGINSGGC